MSNAQKTEIDGVKLGFQLAGGCLLFGIFLIVAVVVVWALGLTVLAAMVYKPPVERPLPSPTPFHAPTVAPALPPETPEPETVITPAPEEPEAENLIPPLYKEQSFTEWLNGDPPVRINPTLEEVVAAQEAAQHEAHWVGVATGIVPGMAKAMVEGLMESEGTKVSQARVNGQTRETRQWLIGPHTFTVEFVNGVVTVTGWS